MSRANTYLANRTPPEEGEHIFMTEGSFFLRKLPNTAYIEFGCFSSFQNKIIGMFPVHRDLAIDIFNQEAILKLDEGMTLCFNGEMFDSDVHTWLKET